MFPRTTVSLGFAVSVILMGTYVFVRGRRTLWDTMPEPYRPFECRHGEIFNISEAVGGKSKYLELILAYRIYEPYKFDS
ncbi:hypothetical protein BDQ17DRAFT_1342199 [Cyathus striatus]|nr:hypothetical protein BDQ17DRAFT_1342199 [Cyathus striatus]